MPPQPITATVLPGSTLAAWNTAPTPVMTPQPTRAARSSGMSWVDLHHRVLVHQHLLGEGRQVERLVERLPVPRSRRAAPGSSFTSVLSQRLGWPVMQYSHSPQNTDRQVMT